MTDATTCDPVLSISNDEWSTPESWMIGAKTRLLDCWEPQMELLRLPAMRYLPWQMAWPIQLDDKSRIPARSVRRPRRALSGTIDLGESSLGVDLRSIGGSNIAHAMIIGVVTFYAIQRLLETVEPSWKPVAILPAGSAPYVLELYKLFEIEHVATDLEVVSRRVDEVLDATHAIQAAPGLLPSRVARLLDSPPTTLSSRIFIARRGTRAISNLSAIERIVHERGFVTVYAEQLSVLDQLRLLWHADEIIAVHGAALALCLPRVLRPDSPLRMIEIFGPGYIVSLYRCLAARLDAEWVGVRGRVTPEVVRDLESLAQDNWRWRLANALRGWVPGRWLPPDRAWQRSHQSSGFEVDAEALLIAIECVRDKEFQFPDRVFDSA